MSKTMAVVTVWLIIGILTLSACKARRDPYKEPDRAFIMLAGDVVDSSSERFQLDYGEGVITVEMDDWDWYDEAEHILPGDRVIVSGRIDADFHQRRTIEAHSVYVRNRSTYYDANDADEEDGYHQYAIATLPDGSSISTTGTVEKVRGHELVLDTGAREIRVDTRAMAYDPVDDLGLQRIREGDRVRVSGRLDLELFERNQIEASSIVILSPNRTKNKR